MFTHEPYEKPPLEKFHRSRYTSTHGVRIMTSVSFCEKCNSLRFTFNETTNEVDRQGEIGMKVSCCGKCSNINCPDYGECTCFDGFFEQQRERIEKMMKDGKIPFSRNDEH